MILAYGSKLTNMNRLSLDILQWLILVQKNLSYKYLPLSIDIRVSNYSSTVVVVIANTLRVTA